MLKWLTCWLTFSQVLATEIPFWKSKEKIYERVQNGEVMLNARSEPRSSPAKARLLKVHGGAQAQAPCKAVMAQVLKPEQLPKATDYIRKATFDRKKSVLDVSIEALGHKAHLKVSLRPDEKSDPQNLHFVILAGPMHGFVGDLTFTPVSSRKCEVGFVGEFKYDHFPLPQSFLEFGLEVVLKRMAARLRAYVETEWEHEHRQGSDGSKAISSSQSSLRFG